MALVFYTNPMSRGRMVRWALEEIGHPYETKLMDYGTTMKDASYRAIHPMGKVPALSHDDVIITETAAIIAHLADAFPAANLAPPPASVQRGPYYRWLFFAAGPYESAVTNRFMGFVVPPERAASVGYGSFETVMDIVSQAVSASPYLLGTMFTAADIYLGAHLSFGLRFGTIEKRPEFIAYCDRLNSRPAALRAAAIDDELLAPPKHS